MSRANDKLAANRHIGGDVMAYLRQREEDNPELAALVRDEHDKRALAHRIRELREEAGMSQAEVAAQIGTKQPSIARIEHGESLPKIDMLQKLARVFGMRVQIEFVPAPRRRRRKARAAVGERATALAGGEAVVVTRRG